MKLEEFRFYENENMKKELLSLYCDSITQFQEIFRKDFLEFNIFSDYNNDVVLAILWKYCMYFRN